MRKRSMTFIRHLTSAFALCALFALPASEVWASSCLLPPSGLAGWWPGNNNANDVIGSNNGAFNGNYIQGEVQEAFNISGSGSDFVTVLQNSSLEPQSITVDAWVNANQSPGNFAYIVDKGASTIDCAGNASYALYTGANGGLQFYVSDGTSVALSPDAGTGIWDGQWHFVAGTYDGASVSLYVDGNLVGSTPASLSINYSFADNNLYFGNYPDCTAQNLSFKGGIDEVEVFSRALLQSEIQAIYNAGSAGKCQSPTLVTYFSPSTVSLYDEATVVVKLINNNNTDANILEPLTDVLPDGLVVSGGFTSNTCGGATTIVDSSTVTIDGTSIPANGFCTAWFNVTSNTCGYYTNGFPIGALETDAGSNQDQTMATLHVFTPCCCGN
ncbi:MAG TPA: LamG domain-containing protein [Myxococcota bacterium]|nr:LamG domain-containing protein [Myxococcota bacterium]